jgi:hypothetical protein
MRAGIMPAPQRVGRVAGLIASRLDQRLRAAIGEGRFGPDRRLLSWPDGLVAGVNPGLAPELRRALDVPRLRDPAGGAALVLNSFLAWRQDLAALQLAGEQGFKELRFDARCPTGVRGTPPHLDLIANNGGALVAVHASGFEYLQSGNATLGAAYVNIASGSGLAPWRELAGRLVGEPGAFRIVDAATVVKHVVGLARTFPAHRLTLLYLFLEPSDAQTHPIFRLHRAELATIAALSRGSAVELRAMSFAELWSDWLGPGRPPWLRAVVTLLQDRYDVVIADPPRG